MAAVATVVWTASASGVLFVAQASRHCGSGVAFFTGEASTTRGFAVFGISGLVCLAGDNVSLVLGTSSLVCLIAAKLPVVLGISALVCLIADKLSDVLGISSLVCLAADRVSARPGHSSLVCLTVALLLPEFADSRSAAT